MRSINKTNEIRVNGQPAGWLVRVLKDGDRIKTADFGVYVKENVFVSVPIHFNVIQSLIKVGGGNESEEYYAIPDTLQLKLIKTKTKSDSTIPMLVPVKQDQQPDFITCMTYEAVPGTAIIDVKTDSTVVRDFIPKERNLMAMILVGKEGVINPSAKIEIKAGTIGGNKLTTITFVSDLMRSASEEGITVETDEPVKTAFINFENRFLPTRRQAAANSERKNNGTEIKTIKNNNFNQPNRRNSGSSQKGYNGKNHK